MSAGASTDDGGWGARHPTLTGVLILLGLHAVFAVVPFALSSLALSSSGDRFSLNWVSIGEWTGFKHEAVPLLVGIVQLYYVIPAVLLALKLRVPAVARGIVLGALATFLLNATGCGVMYWQLSRIEG